MRCVKHIVSGTRLIKTKWKHPPIYNDCIYDNPSATNYPEPLCTLRYYVPAVFRPKAIVFTCMKIEDQNDKIIMDGKEAYTDIRHFVIGTISRSIIYSFIFSTPLLQLYILYNIFLFGYYFDKSWYYYQHKKQTNKMDKIEY